MIRTLKLISYIFAFMLPILLMSSIPLLTTTDYGEELRKQQEQFDDRFSKAPIQ